MRLLPHLLLLALFLPHLPTFDAVAAPSGEPVSRAAILDPDELPRHGQSSSAQSMMRICAAAGWQAEVITAQQLADPRVLARDRYELLMVPTGRAFPAAARPALVQFLCEGGHLVTCGGHAFQELLRRDQGDWVSDRAWVAARRAEALRQDRSLVLDGGFEQSTEIPLGAADLDGRWRRAGDDARLTRDDPFGGNQCATVSLSGGDPRSSGGFHTLVSVTAGHTYHASGYVRARELEGPGIAYLSVYQLDAQGGMVAFRDFAAVREDTDWQQHTYTFTVQAGVTHVRVQCGLYRLNGVAAFDDIRLVSLQDAQFLPINTSWGEPGDGLKVRPDQLGMFDPSYPLRRVARVRTSRDQCIVTAPVDMPLTAAGAAASGVVGYDAARWTPLLDTFDRFGRDRGPAAAMLLHYNGHYAGSCWAYFGVDNVDLFADPEGAVAQVLRQVLEFLRQPTFLHNVRTEQALYRPGETIRCLARVSNHAAQARAGEVLFSLHGSADATPVCCRMPVRVEADATQSVTAELSPPALPETVGRVTAELYLEQRLVDTCEAGFAWDRPDVMASGPELRMSDNYLTLEGRPLFLFGSDTYARTYQSAAENPLTWCRELAAARDIGVRLYENLQYTPRDYRFEEDEWRKFLAMAQLTQQHQLVFMPGMLIGHNTAVGPDLLGRQSRLCGDYAARLGHVPGLLYYINGDYQQRLEEHAEEIQRLWTAWLAARYASLEELHAAWTSQAPAESFEVIPFPPPQTGRWDDVPALDAARFQTELTTRWNDAHVQAVRGADQSHPITSEYYQRPSIGIDLRATIGTQDLSNIGYFDEPEVDLDRLPLQIALADLRARGKGVSLGEYGVKTHPAWSREQGALAYHIRRSEEQQQQLFMAVAHYGLGMGCAKVQNWCLRDAQAWVFPWGLFYPNQLVPKDVAYTHRNLSLMWSHLQPRYETPPLLMALAGNMRLGNDADVGAEIACRAYDDLLSLHLPFVSLDDASWGAIPDATRLVLCPSPFALSDEAFEQLYEWVRGGGTLLVTGDFAYDRDRGRTRLERHERLAGVAAEELCYPDIARARGGDRAASFSLAGVSPAPVRPCVELQPRGAEVLGRDEQGRAVLVHHVVGTGNVFYCSDPLELAGDATTRRLRRELYAAVARHCGITPTAPEAPPWCHVLRQPTRTGTAYVVFNQRRDGLSTNVSLPTSAGAVVLRARDRWPAAALVRDDGDVCLVTADGFAASPRGTLLQADGYAGLLALDGQDLRDSQALLVAPFEPSSIRLPDRDGSWVVVAGESVGGRWTSYDVMSLSQADSRLRVDEDLASLLLLVCRPAERPQWEEHLTTMFTQPHRVPGW